MNVNKVILAGRLGNDPTISYTTSGKAVVNFNLATSEKIKKDHESTDKTTWHKIVVWGKLAELTNQYLEKGSLVYIEGKIDVRSWDDKDGNKKYSHEIVAYNVQWFSSKKSEGFKQEEFNNF